jgi:hypothetical protein
MMMLDTLFGRVHIKIETRRADDRPRTTSLAFIPCYYSEREETLAEWVRLNPVIAKTGFVFATFKADEAMDMRPTD